MKASEHAKTIAALILCSGAPMMAQVNDVAPTVDAISPNRPTTYLPEAIGDPVFVHEARMQHLYHDLSIQGNVDGTIHLGQLTISLLLLQEQVAKRQRHMQARPTTGTFYLDKGLQVGDIELLLAIIAGNFQTWRGRISGRNLD